MLMRNFFMPLISSAALISTAGIVTAFSTHASLFNFVEAIIFPIADRIAQLYADESVPMFVMDVFGLALFATALCQLRMHTETAAVPVALTGIWLSQALITWWCIERGIVGSDAEGSRTLGIVVPIALLSLKLWAAGWFLAGRPIEFKTQTADGRVIHPQ